jgi:hypothetical protein
MRTSKSTTTRSSTYLAAQISLQIALSRPPGVDKGEEDNQNITMIPLKRFKTLTVAIWRMAIRIETVQTLRRG